MRSNVGAGLPAMVVNDNALRLILRGALGFIAGKPAPTLDLISRPFLLRW